MTPELVETPVEGILIAGTSATTVTPATAETITTTGTQKRHHAAITSPTAEVLQGQNHKQGR